jgi:sterol desaturase/sphingolipid hydroxylase (fatty acid hydroxylase superfamily)
LELLASASIALPPLLLSGIVLAFVTALWGGAATLSPFAIPTTLGSALLCLLLIDFLYYWDHRMAHTLRPYWALAHSVHHSSPQYDQTTALRVSFTDGFFSPWFYLPALLVGFDLLLVVACFGVMLSYQQWLHTESIGRLRFFDGWLNTPANHRVHHGVQDEYLDKNYGAILMVWDRLFGTYAAEVAPVRYGLTQPIHSSNPWVIHTIEAKRWWQDLRAAKSWSSGWRTFLWMPVAAAKT